AFWPINRLFCFSLDEKKIHQLQDQKQRMSNWIVYGIGFLAQLLFGTRLLVQWVLSEKNRLVITPSLYWKMSLLASILLFLYGYLRNDFAIIFGQTLTYYIYIRNLQLQGEWQRTPKWFQLFLFVFPVCLVFYAFNNDAYDLEKFFDNEAIPHWLLLLGIFSQIVFTFRYFYQWIYSEKQNSSQLPIGFWRISVLGASLILAYAVFRKGPVLFVGHVAGLFIYIPNISLWKKQPGHEN